MIIKEVHKSQAKQIAKLYYETVNHINIRDYSESQIKAWAAAPESEEYWLSRWENCLVLVAMSEEDQKTILGFVEFRPHGEIDCFYVSHLAQRRGVGRAMLERVFQEARKLPITELWADVSLTARPFFEWMGFFIEKEQIRNYRGENFKQFLMKRKNN